MKGYFDQNFKTKFSKQIMSNNLGFQWVVDEMENEFEYPTSDVTTFDSFFSMLMKYSQHIEYFIRIYKIDESTLNINNEFINILSDIARFAYKKISVTNILKKNIYKNFTILYILGLIGGIVQKSKGIGKYDFGMFVYYNWFELFEIKKMPLKYKKNIDRLLRILTILEKNKISNVYYSNFNEVKKTYREKNLKMLNKYDKLFYYFGYKMNIFCTWQENYILNISQMHFSISNEYNYRYDLINDTALYNMKNFFQNNSNAMIILDIFEYKKNNKTLTLKTQKVVLEQVLRRIKNKKIMYDFDNIWFYILIKSAKEKSNFIKDNLNKIYLELKKKRNIQIILFLKEKGFVINKDLQTKIDRHYIKQIKEIEKIEDLNSFNTFLKEDYIISNANLKIVKRIRELFYKLTEKYENDMQVSNCFFNIVNFLIEVKKKINDNTINNFIFEILEIWNIKYYEKMHSLLQVHTYETRIETQKIKEFNELFLQIPITILRNHFSWNEKKILDKMTKISEFALSTMMRPNTIFIDKFIPYYKRIDTKNKDSLEYIICDYLNDTQLKYEEQLLNTLIPLEYLYSIYDDYEYTLTSFINLINNDIYKVMYNDIKKSFLKYSLLAYPKNVKMAHITQLIPLLELLIRELGIKNKILPFKEKCNQIHVMKDSSTILLAIIKNEYKKNKNFNNIEVYIFLYNYLYNVNSLNLRNELIHAREYLDDENKMRFAFRVLIIGIFWALLELYL